MLKNMTQGTPWRLIVMFGLPLLVGNVFQQAYNLVDTIIIGNFVGPVALAGVGVASPVFNLISALLIGLSVGSSIMVSQLFGAGRSRELPTAMSTIMVVSFALAIVLTVIGQLVTVPLLNLLQTPQEDMPYAVAYLRVIILGLVFNVAYNQLSGLLRGLGNSAVPLYFLIFSSVLNVALDLLFVAVFRWEVAGAAFATILSQGVSALLTYIYIRVKVPLFRRQKGDPIFEKQLLSTTVHFGLPMALQQSSISLGHLLMQGLINPFDTVVIAAYAAGTKVDMFAVMPLISLGSAASTFAAQNAGAGNLDRIRYGYRTTNYLAAGIGICLSILVVSNREFLMSLFVSTKDYPVLAPEIIATGMQMMAIMPCFYVVLALIHSCLNTLSGAGDTTFSMVAMILMMGLRIVLAWAFINLGGMDETGIWWSFPSSWIIVLAIVLIHYFRGGWTKKALYARKVKQ